MVNEPAIVMRNIGLGERLFMMTLRSPEIARTILPGQFVHMEIPTLQANILRRPFSVYDVDVEAGTYDIVYQVLGAGTEDMAKWQPGYLTTTIGPIGHGWQPPENTQHALLVGGGVGAAPLLMLCQALVQDDIEVDVILGAQTASALVCRDRFEAICTHEVSYATDDGTLGAHGFCTVCLEGLLEDKTYDYAAVCGPEPMIRAASALTQAAHIPTQVSLERRMACGIGACLSCTCDTTSGKRRVCVDGPVFDAAEMG